MKIFRKALALAVCVMFALNISGCATYQVHPEFKERHKTIKSVSIMPPKVEAYILNFQGDKKMLSELVPVMEKTTIEKLEKVFSDKGYQVNKLDLSEENLSKNPNLRTSLFHINELFEKQLQNIQKRKKSKFTYSVEAEANIFANLSSSDVLIFVKEDGIKKSAGEIAKDVAKGLMISAACILVGAIYIPIPQTAATVVHVAIVDGNDGAILWYNNNITTPNYDPENQKQLGVLIGSLVNPFPESVFKPKDAKAGIADKVKPVAAPGSEVSPAPAATPATI